MATVICAFLDRLTVFKLDIFVQMSKDQHLRVVSANFDLNLIRKQHSFIEIMLD